MQLKIDNDQELLDGLNEEKGSLKEKISNIEKKISIKNKTKVKIIKQKSKEDAKFKSLQLIDNALEKFENLKEESLEIIRQDIEKTTDKLFRK